MTPSSYGSAAPVCFLRRMLRISWTDKVSNDKVLQRANTSKNLLKVIVSMQIRFVGHDMRKNQLEAVALTGMIEGKRAGGRHRKTFMDWISTACADKNGTSTKFWKFVETVMSICWSPTSESDMALTSDRSMLWREIIRWKWSNSIIDSDDYKLYVSVSESGQWCGLRPPVLGQDRSETKKNRSWSCILRSWSWSCRSGVVSETRSMSRSSS